MADRPVAKADLSAHTPMMAQRVPLASLAAVKQTYAATDAHSQSA